MLEPSYDAFTVEVKDVPALHTDALQCKGYALAYRPGLSLGRIGTAGVQGAANNAGAAALNPLIPALGALGGAGSEVLENLRILSDKQRKVYLSCLRQKGQKSGLYMVLEPE